MQLPISLASTQDPNFPPRTEKSDHISYGGVSIDASSVAIVDIIVGRYFAIGLPTAHWRIMDT